MYSLAICKSLPAPVTWACRESWLWDGALGVPVGQLGSMSGPLDGVHEAISRIHTTLILLSSPGCCSSNPSWPCRHVAYNSEKGRDGMGQERKKPLWQHLTQLGKLCVHWCALTFPHRGNHRLRRDSPGLELCHFRGRLMQAKSHYFPNPLQRMLELFHWTPGLPRRLFYLWVMVSVRVLQGLQDCGLWGARAGSWANLGSTARTQHVGGWDSPGVFWCMMLMTKPKPNRAIAESSGVQSC